MEAKKQNCRADERRWIKGKEKDEETEKIRERKEERGKRKEKREKRKEKRGKLLAPMTRTEISATVSTNYFRHVGLCTA